MRHPHRGKGKDVAQRDNHHRGQHGPRIRPLRAFDFRGDGRGIVPSHVVPHADEQPAKNVDRRGRRPRHGIGQRTQFEWSQHHDRHKRSRQREEQPQRSERNHFDAGDIQYGASDDHRERHPPAAIPLLKPREHARQISDEEGGIDCHVEDGRNQREPGFLKSPKVAHGAAHPGVVAAFLGQSARKLADHESRGQAPEQRREQQNQNRASVAGSVDDLFGAIGSARHHKEGGGDQGPHGEPNEFFPIGYGGEGLGFLSLQGASSCQFLWLPPQATHSHHLVSLEVRLEAPG